MPCVSCAVGKKNSCCDERVKNELSWSRAPSNRHVQFQSGRKTSVWLVTGYGWSWALACSPSAGCEVGMAQFLRLFGGGMEAGSPEGRVWEVPPTPPLHRRERRPRAGWGLDLGHPSEWHSRPSSGVLSGKHWVAWNVDSGRRGLRVLSASSWLGYLLFI